MTGNSTNTENTQTMDTMNRKDRMDKSIKKAIKATIGTMLELLIGIGGSLAISLDKSSPYWLRYCGMTVFATILLFVTIVFGILLFLATYTYDDRTDPQSNE